MVTPHDLPAVRAASDADRPGLAIGEEVVGYLRAELGAVRLGYRPSDPIEERLDLLARACDRETFQAVMSA